MSWIPVLFVFAGIAGLFALKRMSFVPAGKARQLLREGALVVDVRSPAEFAAGHVAGAVNVPLGSLDSEAPTRFLSKDQALLLHCLSGARSGMARTQLQRLGYANVFNLGSYGRAEAIVRTSRLTADGPTAAGGSTLP